MPSFIEDVKHLRKKADRLQKERDEARAEAARWQTQTKEEQRLADSLSDQLTKARERLVELNETKARLDGTRCRLGEVEQARLKELKESADEASRLVGLLAKKQEEVERLQERVSQLCLVRDDLIKGRDTLADELAGCWQETRRLLEERDGLAKRVEALQSTAESLPREKDAVLADRNRLNQCLEEAARQRNLATEQDQLVRQLTEERALALGKAVRYQEKVERLKREAIYLRGRAAKAETELASLEDNYPPRQVEALDARVEALERWAAGHEAYHGLPLPAPEGQPEAPKPPPTDVPPGGTKKT